MSDNHGEKVDHFWLNKCLGLEFPVIMAPMFLVSNELMLVEAYHSGIIGCIPSLNARTNDQLQNLLTSITQKTKGQYGVNLIANKSNLKLQDHLDITLKSRPRFIITSLGNPSEIIKKAHQNGILVFCDVTDLEYALKVQSLGADAVIAVHSGSAGHAGNIPSTILIPLLKKKLHIPVISAGGVASGEAFMATKILGADGLSIGTPFIATHESPVSDQYKNSLIQYGSADIALSTKISGTPLTVIKTPFVQKMGLHQNFLERYLNNNKKLKKYSKIFTFYKGMKRIEKAAMKATYQSVWCAGPSIEYVDQILCVKELVEKMKFDYNNALDEFKKQILETQ